MYSAQMSHYFHELLEHTGLLTEWRSPAIAVLGRVSAEGSLSVCEEDRSSSISSYDS
jgi:hypothetical protein